MDSWIDQIKAGLVLGIAFIAGATLAIIHRDYIHTTKNWTLQLQGTAENLAWVMTNALDESQDDAQLLADFPAVGAYLLVRPTRPAALNEILDLLDEYRTIYEYDSAGLYRPDGSAIATKGGGAGAREVIQKAATTRTLQRALAGETLVFAVPLIKRGRPIAVVAITDRIERELLPLLTTAHTRVGKARLVTDAGYRPPRSALAASKRIAVGTVVVEVSRRQAYTAFWVTAGLVAGTALAGIGLLLALTAAYRRDLAARKLKDQFERERREAVEKLNRLLEERVQERTAELESFTHSVAHDLRAPLRHIGASSGRLQSDYGAQLTGEAAECLGIIAGETREMGQMIDALLDLARLARSDLSRTKTDLGEIAEQARREAQRQSNGRAIDWQIGELPTIEADPRLVKQVFRNLFANAVKYTRPRVEAVIKVGHRDGVVYVQDNGVGFDMEHAQKLFGVFQRLHGREEFEGTGVGLATVRRIMQKHDGRVWAEAEPGRGATFYLSFASEPEALEVVEEAVS